jgi:hypothetical protein
MRRIAILGRAEGTLSLAPIDDPEWEIWSMPWVKQTHRVDRFHDPHTQLFWDKSVRNNGWEPRHNRDYPDVPVYCDSSRVGMFKCGRVYPLDTVSGVLPVRFLECTVAYQIAQAIHEEADEIGLYGVHLGAGTEYGYQRPSVMYLIGLAQGRGIKVTVPKGCPLFKSSWMAGRYGVDVV